jgi:hypothetical protein
MKIRIPMEHYEFLQIHIPESIKNSTEVLQNEGVNTFIDLDVESDVADQIRDWAMERQVIIGFDMDYNLTSEGKILEVLIDLFYE